MFSLVLTALVFLTKDGIPGFGLLWNVRLLPFLFLLRYLLAMVGIVEIVWGIAADRHDRRIAQRVARSYPEPAGLVLVGRLSPARASARKFFASIAVLGMVGAVGLGWLSWHLGKFPGQKETYVASGKSNKDKYRFEFLGIDVATSDKNGFVDGWARHNFTGYEGKGAYGEYRALIEQMKTTRRRPGARLRPGVVGAHRRRLRHADGADVAAVLDRQLHRLDGGPVLRGLGDYAVPLPQRGGDV